MREDRFCSNYPLKRRSGVWMRSKRLTSGTETEEDHIERKRRKDKRKAWRRQRVRERELRLSSGIISTRSTDDDDYYFDAEQQRREWAQQIREPSDGLPHS